MVSQQLDLKTFSFLLNMAFFTSTKKGEIQEMKEGINSTNVPKKKEAMKRIIGSMMSGVDVSSLLPAVLVNMQTTDLELKKLIYLYLVNYSKSEPELALHAVNTFDKDTKNPNPLVRALALRTMGCIRIDQITEYMCEPLHRCLKDSDPYVKKTAVLGVAKMYDISPQLVEDEGFIDMLLELLGDGNPMVVSNAVASLSEIQSANPGRSIMRITPDVLQKLTAALGQASEWGQAHILDALAVWYTPEGTKDAERVAERVAQHLAHDNAAVVLSAAKVILRLLGSIEKVETATALCRRMAPPLISLLSSPPEIRYVALRNISLVVQRLPNLLAGEIKAFFCKYNDPLYVKLEKLEIMMLLVSSNNVGSVLTELREYAAEVDVDFVRKAVRAIGRCAILLPDAAGQCVDALVRLVETSQVNHVVQEAVIVIKDIFRRYPGRYESVITKLCEKLQALDEPEARAAMVWILGEYAEHIDQADKILADYFAETFADEAPQVQLAILTAAVKVFLAVPESKALVENIIRQATRRTDNPDLRDRGYIYWRLLSGSKDLAHSVVRCKKPPITAQRQLLPKEALNELIPFLGTLASVFHKPPETFGSVIKVIVPRVGAGQDEDDQPSPDEKPAGLQERKAKSGVQSGSTTPTQQVTAPPGQKQEKVKPNEAIEARNDEDEEENFIDLTELGIVPQNSATQQSSIPQTTTAPTQSGVTQPRIPTSTASIPPTTLQSPFTAPAVPPKLPLLLQHESGLQVNGDFVVQGGKLYFAMTLINGSQSTPIVSQPVIQFNKNSFGLAPHNLEFTPLPIATGGDVRSTLLICSQRQELLSSTPQQPQPFSPLIQMAMKTEFGLLFFNQTAKIYALAQIPNPVPLIQAKDRATLLAKSAPADTTVAVNVLPAAQAVGLLVQGYGFLEVDRKNQGDLLLVKLYGVVALIQGEIVVDLIFRPTPQGVLAMKIDVFARPDGIGKLLSNQLGELLTIKSSV
ncbi:MAG: putative AP-1 complex subunit beta-1 [Streblomastix strix]|uniref:Putative AP-1 complex subunit beta-1 n=1 Tax=Streblomastix strix TaxID=222440 RepID=A0A5J4W6B6_9EUKA|nr:MAG: putative AP-1 complex subunit beta-1 [Streblomastix strix]